MQNSILILLLYYERPSLVKNALASILKSDQQYKKWELAFIDDSSPTPGEPIARQMLSQNLGQVKFYNTNMTVEEKKATGGMVGKMMNQAIKDSSADVGIMLCDDDELYPNYFAQLNYFLNKRPATQSCYCHVHMFNPGVENTTYVDRLDNYWNKNRGPINGRNRLDASQVAWRLSVNKGKDVWFQEKRTSSLDGPFFDALRRSSGRSRFTGLVGQYKGVHGTALTHQRMDEVWAGRPIDTQAAIRSINPGQYLKLIDHYNGRNISSEAIRIANLAISVHGVDGPEMKTIHEFLLKSGV